MESYNPRFSYTVHNFKMVFDDGTEIDIYRDENMSTKNPIDLGSEVELLSDELDEGDGYIGFGEKRSGRSLVANLFYIAYDRQDFQLRRDHLSRLFARYEEFWIIRDSEPTKRLKVRRIGAIVPVWTGGDIAEVSIEFSAASPYWESVGTTKDLHADPSSDLWGFGSGLSTDRTYKYLFPGNVGIVDVWNLGTAPIDSRQEITPVKIVITGVTDGIQIRNLDTGDEWRYNGTSAANDVITLDGVLPDKNGTNIFSGTNAGAFSLRPGLNRINITGGAPASSVSIENRFYYE